MGAPRTGFKRGLADLYDYLDTELPAGAPRSNSIRFVASWGSGADANTAGARYGSYDYPFKTLDYAIGQCEAGKGDLIVVKQGHSETVTGAGGITADVSHVNIVGLGEGDQRPTFLMDGAATVSALITAANVRLENLIFKSGHASVVKGIDISATGAVLKRLAFLQNTTSENFLTPVKVTSTTDGAADGLQVRECFMYQVDSGTLEFIELNGDVTNARIEGNVAISEGTASPLILCATGKDLKGVRVIGNFLSHKMTSGNLFISNDTASPNNSGVIAHNRCRHADVTGAHAMGAVGGCGFFDNLSASVDNLSGFVLPAIDVDL